MTVSRSFYDVVVVGGSLGALAAGALLSRRGFRVAWIRHTERANTYAHAGLTLRRAHESMPFVESPSFRRVTAELALTPVVRRRLRLPEPAFQVALPGHRVDARAGMEPLLAELEREFPELRRPMEAFYAAMARHMIELDALFAADRVWPASGFFERRGVLRAAGRITCAREPAPDPFADFPAHHPFRAFVQAQARFATATDPDDPHALRLVRAHGSAIRGAASFEGGRDALARLFEEKITQHGGDVFPRENVARIVTERGRVKAVDLAAADERFGCAFVLTSLDVAAAYRLAEHTAGRAAGEVILSRNPRYHRFTVNVVLAPGGIPAGMATRVFLVVDSQRPLSEENLLAIECAPPETDGRAALTVQTLLPRASVEEGEPYLHKQRERVLASLRTLIPFLDRNLLAVDSPHDGLPYEDRATGEASVPADRRRDAIEPMAVIERAETHGLLGICAVPARGEVANLLLLGAQVVPGLGEEGEWLAALSAARIVTRTDRSKERLRRELWSKVDV